jgi:hypothetical protein
VAEPRLSKSWRPNLMKRGLHDSLLRLLRQRALGWIIYQLVALLRPGVEANRCIPLAMTMAGGTLMPRLYGAYRLGTEGVSDEDFGRRVQAALGFTAEKRDRQHEWMLDPEIKKVGRQDAERALRQVLAHRVWVDQR